MFLVCLGTDNGRSTVSIANNMNHYERLKRSFIRCRRIIGNLEITHIDEKDYSEIKQTNANNQTINHPFEFLKDLEEV